MFRISGQHQNHEINLKLMKPHIDVLKRRPKGGIVKTFLREGRLGLVGARGLTAVVLLVDPGGQSTDLIAECCERTMYIIYFIIIRTYTYV